MSGILGLYQKDPLKARHVLEDENVKIVTSYLGVREICVGGENIGNIDELARSIIKEQNKSRDDRAIAQKLTDLYDTFLENPELQSFAVKEREFQAKDISLQLHGLIYHDFVNFIEKGKEVVIETLRGMDAQVRCEEISNKTKEDGKSELEVKLPDGRDVMIRKEYRDTVKRGIFTQLKKIQDQYGSLSQNVQKAFPLKKIKEHIKIIEEGETKQTTEAKLEKSYDFLGDLFLMDLLEKLGPDREHFMGGILLFLEQSYSNRLLAEIITQLGSLAKPLVINVERIITIPSDPKGVVELTLVADCSKECVELRPESSIYIPEEKLSQGIRAALTIKLGESEDDMSFSIKAKKLDKAPSKKKSSDVYPIVLSVKKR